MAETMLIDRLESNRAVVASAHAALLVDRLNQPTARIESTPDSEKLRSWAPIAPPLHASVLGLSSSPRRHDPDYLNLSAIWLGNV